MEKVVQDVTRRLGPWVLFAPPGSDERTFFLQHLVFPHLLPPKFEIQVANPLKIRSRYYHIGDPHEVFNEFRAHGYEFVDEVMPVERYEELEELALEDSPRFT